MRQNNFNALYKASLPPAVLKLIQTPEGPSIEGIATELQQMGYQIDMLIMCYKWDPYETMLIRIEGGWAWVPALGMQPVTSPPGINFPFPGDNPYQPTPPPGAIIVPPLLANPTDASNDAKIIAMYPPYQQPA